MVKEEPVSYDLLVAVKGDDGLFVVNQGTTPFPLGPLTLGVGENMIQGGEWDVALLEPGDCVVAWKNDREFKLPDGLTCRAAGEVVTREGKDRFWRQAFDIAYNGKVVGTCEKEHDECPVTVQMGRRNVYLPLVLR